MNASGIYLAFLIALLVIATCTPHSAVRVSDFEQAIASYRVR